MGVKDWSAGGEIEKSDNDGDEGGVPFCAHCGGRVGADGYAMGGEVEEFDDVATKDTPDMKDEYRFDEADKARAGLIAPDSEQQARTRSFVDAMRRRGGR